MQDGGRGSGGTGVVSRVFGAMATSGDAAWALPVSLLRFFPSSSVVARVLSYHMPAILRQGYEALVVTVAVVAILCWGPI